VRRTGNCGRSCWRPRAAAKSTWCWCGAWIVGADPCADLLATLQELQHLGVGFVSLTEALDLTTPAGRAMAALLAVFAEFEREILRERVRAGLAHARRNGKKLGRPATAARHASEIRKLHRAGVSKSEIARRLEIGRTSVRRILG
jgi:putative DNA-invertase from lambdoid prophage Rac